jgi:hypothetical protein
MRLLDPATLSANQDTLHPQNARTFFLKCSRCELDRDMHHFRTELNVVVASSPLIYVRLHYALRMVIRVRSTNDASFASSLKENANFIGHF